MRPLSAWPVADRARVVGVFTDIDDTLTTDGAITPDALAALEALHAAGLTVIPITGRPIGWSEAFARTLPVDALVAENGAAAWVFEVKKGQAGNTGGTLLLSKWYQQDVATRARNFARMQQAAQRVLREVAGAHLAEDSPGRECDMAIDHSEFHHLDAPRIAAVVRILREEGMNATVSSIHINGWYGTHHKLDGAHWIVRERLGRDLDREIHRWVYVGDSTNDQRMFEAFPHSIGVANIRRFLPELTHQPRYVTPSERGAGFAEVVRHLLAHRRAA